MYIGTGSKDGAMGEYKVKQPLKLCANQHLSIYGLLSIYLSYVFKNVRYIDADIEVFTPASVISG